MSDEKQLKQAKTVYKSLCDMLDGRNWHYKRDDEALRIQCGAQGEDLPIDIMIEIDQKRMLVTLLSKMPFTIPENRRKELAVAVSQANNGMVDGSFDYDFLSGRILFRLTSSYRESLIGKTMLEYMLICSCQTVDDYNDKFLLVAKNNMTVDEILEFIK